MTISELEKKSKNKTLSKGERVLLETKKRIEEEKKKGVVYFEGSTIKKYIKIDF